VGDPPGQNPQALQLLGVLDLLLQLAPLLLGLHPVGDIADNRDNPSGIALRVRDDRCVDLGEEPTAVFS
jgi:hypothetical protein